jgi:HPt (histidine-containing phosphotransfer) domain-containing protein
MLDTEVLGELRSLGDDDLRDIFAMYFTDVEAQLGRLHAALADGDGDALAAAAHRIKGASLSIGASRVAALAAELESAGRDDELGQCDELLSSLEADLDPTRNALSAELSVELSR